MIIILFADKMKIARRFREQMIKRREEANSVLEQASKEDHTFLLSKMDEARVEAKESGLFYEKKGLEEKMLEARAKGIRVAAKFIVEHDGIRKIAEDIKNIIDFPMMRMDVTFHISSFVQKVPKSKPNFNMKKWSLKTVLWRSWAILRVPLEAKNLQTPSVFIGFRENLCFS